MIDLYRPQDHYWMVAGTGALVYHSARRAYVSTSDAAYQAWRASGNAPTRIASETELWEVLAAQYPEGLPDLPAAEDAYADVAFEQIPASIRVALRMIDKRSDAAFEAALKNELKAKRPKA